MVSKATNDAVWDWNIPSGQLWWNESFEGLFGYAHEDRDSSIEAWKSMVHPEDHERVARQLRELIDRGENIWVDEYRLRRKDGTYADVLDRGYVIRNEAGKAIRMIGAVMDITERKQYEKEILRLNTELENRVKQRTTELEVANQELEAFSYSISHDLRAPLRTINGFSRVVQEDFAGVLPNEGRRQLQIIRNGAEKMGVLIDDLLKFSRLSRLPLRKSEVNTMGLVEQVLAETSELRAGREIQITVHPLPSCLADPSLLKQVWVNLLSNAFKYTQQQSRPEVVIGCRTDAGEKTFFIRDNGTGFDMRYAGKLFGVFQRLHRSDEFEGTGVGLAIVQRIVHRHGGRVWAEAKPGEGATFFFSLDQEKPNESGSKH
jgi:PAS domain S-box-containing protein